MILNNFEEIEICGQKYKLKYNLRAAAGVERDLGKNFIFDLPKRLSEGDIPPLMDVFTLFKHGFVEGNPKTDGWKDDDVAEIFEAAVYEYSLIQVEGLCIKALKTAGVLELKPKKKLFQNVGAAQEQAGQNEPSDV